MRRARRLHGATPPTLTDPPPAGADRTLSVTVVGTGTIKDNRDGINTPTTVNATYPDGTLVALLSTPTAPATKVTYSGGLTGTFVGTSTVNLTMDANKTVTATFAA